MVSFDFMSNLAPKGLGGAALAKAGVLAGQIVGIGIVGILVYFFVLRKILYYKIKVYIFARRGESNVVIGTDNGRIHHKKDGTVTFKLWKRKHATIDTPSYESLFPDEKAKSCVFLAKYGENEYVILDPSSVFQTPGFPFNPIPSPLREMHVQQHRGVYQKYHKPDLLREFGPYLIMIIGFVLVMITWWMTLGRAEALIGQIGGVGHELAEAIKEFGQMMVPPAP